MSAPLESSNTATFHTDLEEEKKNGDPKPVRYRYCQRPFLERCLPQGCSHKFCLTYSSLAWLFFWYFILVLIVNLACEPAPFSPFYGSSGSGSADPAAVFFPLVVLVIAGFSLYKLRIKKNLEILPVKLLVIVLIYLSLSVVLFLCMNSLVYTDNGEGEGRTGFTFKFQSSWDETELLAYNQVFESASYNSSFPITPVIFFDGLGTVMYDSVSRSLDYLGDYIDASADPIAFDVHSFSYRGFAPNDNAGFPSERKLIDDAMSFFSAVQARYPSQRIILLSHSLGTGPTTALLELLQDRIACCALAMPFQSLRDVIMEVTLYTTMAYYWAAPSWPSYKRIQGMDPAVPLIVVSAGQDELIAPYHQRTIRANANANFLDFFYLDSAFHNDIKEVLETNTTALSNFVTKCLDRSQ